MLQGTLTTAEKNSLKSSMETASKIKVISLLNDQRATVTSVLVAISTTNRRSVTILATITVTVQAPTSVIATIHATSSSNSHIFQAGFVTAAIAAVTSAGLSGSITGTPTATMPIISTTSPSAPNRNIVTVNTGAIVGGVLGSVVLLAIIVIVKMKSTRKNRVGVLGTLRPLYTHTNTHTHTHIYIYIYI